MGSLRDRVRARHPSSAALMRERESPIPTPDLFREAIDWAYLRATDPETLYLDTETTGLDGGAEVVDVAVVAADGRVVFESLVRPRARIPANASAIHGIHDRHVVDSPDWPTIFGRLAPLLAGRVVVVYNAPFDRRMVEQCCRRHGLDAPTSEWECAMRRFAAFQGERSARGSLRLHKLEHAVTRFGAAPGGHRAAADALACRAVVHGMAALAIADDSRPRGSAEAQ